MPGWSLQELVEPSLHFPMKLPFELTEKGLDQRKDVLTDLSAISRR